tara:strand:- start:408 stop:716 length:309 start_codon:yes stop_codon:yes gene_type:complete
MANNVEADHDRAWVEAFEIAPKVVAIDGTNVNAIYNENVETSLDRGGDGLLDKTAVQEITIRKSEAPTINAQTTVLIDSTTFRVNGFRNAGRKALTLILETP